MQRNATVPSDQAAQHFEERILPAVKRHARFAFRWMRNPADRDDAVQETIAVCWAWTRRLASQGKDASEFATTLATFASRQVNAGRHLCGSESTKDVLSRRARARHGFRVESLPVAMQAHQENLYGRVDGQRRHDEYEERLVDNTQTPPDEQAAFRIDFPEWLGSLTAWERRLIMAMAVNERTKDLAKSFDLSPARISQLRGEFHDDWQRFQGESCCY